jgi:hypothetical protein
MDKKTNIWGEISPAAAVRQIHEWVTQCGLNRRDSHGHAELAGGVMYHPPLNKRVQRQLLSITRRVTQEKEGPEGELIPTPAYLVAILARIAEESWNCSCGPDGDIDRIEEKIKGSPLEAAYADEKAKVEKKERKEIRDYWAHLPKRKEGNDE